MGKYPGAPRAIPGHFGSSMRATRRHSECNSRALLGHSRGTLRANPGLSEGTFGAVPGYSQGPEVYIFTWGHAKKGVPEDWSKFCSFPIRPRGGFVGCLGVYWDPRDVGKRKRARGNPGVVLQRTDQGAKWPHHTNPNLGVPGGPTVCLGTPGGRRWGRFEQISRPGGPGEGCGLRGRCGWAARDQIWTRSRSGDQI